MPNETEAPTAAPVEIASVYEAPAAAGPMVHVLAIGVGRYPYLIDGDATYWADQPLGLGQLTSPPVSVKAFVDFFLGRPIRAGLPAFVNPDVPLGSIWALASATADVVVGTPDCGKTLLPATRQNIKAAFEKWLERLGTHDENIGVFYFCGHGVIVDNQYLLAEDFGDDNAEPWNKAFDIDDTLAAVARSVKGTVFCFIDACRQFSQELLNRRGKPPALREPDISKPVVQKSMTLIQATGEGKLAFAEPGQVSRFTSALLTAMSGFCGVRPSAGATWDVDGELLCHATRKLLEAASRGTDSQQVNDQATKGVLVPLLRLPTAPLVRVGIDLIPGEMRALARIFVTRGAAAPIKEQVGVATPFSFEIQRGFYDIGVASLEAGTFRDCLYKEEELIPPTYDLPIRVQP